MHCDCDALEDCFDCFCVCAARVHYASVKNKLNCKRAARCAATHISQQIAGDSGSILSRNGGGRPNDIYYFAPLSRFLILHVLQCFVFIF